MNYSCVAPPLNYSCGELKHPFKGNNFTLEIHKHPVLYTVCFIQELKMTSVFRLLVHLQFGSTIVLVPILSSLIPLYTLYCMSTNSL